MKSENKIEKESAEHRKEVIRIDIATDHAGFKLKMKLTVALKCVGYEVEDLGAYELVISDDFPDVVLPMHQNY